MANNFTSKTQTFVRINSLSQNMFESKLNKP